MAIIIPSKNIYSISFDPVIDNNIDKIEVNANKVNVQIDKDNLSYTETVIMQINQGEIDGQIAYETSAKNFDTQTVTIADNGYINTEFEFLAYSEMKLGFLSIPIKIYDTSYQDKLITDLYDGKDENGNDRIEYTSRYQSREYLATGEWTYVGVKEPKDTDTVTFTTSSTGEPATYKNGKIINDTLTNNPQNKVSFDGNNIKYHFELSQSFKPQNAFENVNLNVSINLSLADKTNVSTAKFTEGTDENGKYFAITLNVLVFRKITTLVNSDYQNGYASLGSKPNSRPMSGAQYRDIATRVEFTFHGETRFLNIAELIQPIGDINGKRVFSVDNNELIQTTNTYNGLNAIEKDFNKTIESYKNGKQNAVISCPIADYYDEDGNKVIDISTDGIMLFQEGDIVIPYTYTNNGDKPLSYNKDFTPKQFKVVGTKISKRQGGTQELTLQEI